MPNFSVDPETLRATASSADAVVERTSAVDDLAHPSDLGHASLSDAVTGFVAEGASSWRTRAMETEAIAAGLRESASSYEAADDDGARDARAGGGGTF